MPDQVKVEVEGLAGERKQERQTAAIEKVQTRIDGMRQPGDIYLDEYMQSRAMIVKGAADMDAQDMQAQLDSLEEKYKADRLRELDSTTPEYTARAKEIDLYVTQVNSVLGAANRKLSKTVDGWTGDVADYLYLSPTAAEGQKLGEVVPGGERQDDPNSGPVDSSYGGGGGQGPSPYPAQGQIQRAGIRMGASAVPGGSALMALMGNEPSNDPMDPAQAYGESVNRRSSTVAGAGLMSPLAGSIMDKLLPYRTLAVDEEGGITVPGS